MALRLVLETADDSASQGAARRKDFGDNVFVGDLSHEYRCYAFYYPGPMPEPKLEQALQKFGEQTGQNLFINIGRLNDPDYGKITNLFDITRSPVIVMTAIAPLAAPDDTDLNTYVRLDSAKLLASPERTLQFVNEIFTLFLRGKVAGAIQKGKWRKRSEVLEGVGDLVRNALRGLWEFISERDISISVIEGRFELKKSGE